MGNKLKVYGYVVAPSGNRDSITEQIEKLNEFAPDSILTDKKYKSTTNRMSLNHILDVLNPKDILVTTMLLNIGQCH